MIEDRDSEAKSNNDSVVEVHFRFGGVLPAI